MRVFLDTNVLVAAFATRGLCADLLRHVLAEHRLLIGEVVLEELQRALRRKLKLPPEHESAIIDFLRQQEVVARPTRAAAAPARDPADRWVLASALDARADVLVTGDDDLLELTAGQAGIRILSPRDFWEIARRKR
ncbi:MAG: putative toxin-antitoxin system toxin component, PIN family [Acidobacteria bacterium]|nr:putative toxin-antitoxin system toxin component, PIN family [Acidobacteriota bacterium]